MMSKIGNNNIDEKSVSSSGHIELKGFRPGAAPGGAHGTLTRGTLPRRGVLMQTFAIGGFLFLKIVVSLYTCIVGDDA